MAPLAQLFDLASLRLRPGQGRRLELSVPLDGVTLGGERYEVQPPTVRVMLEVSRMAGEGYALRIDFDAAPAGRCMRCLKDASPSLHVDAREVNVPGAGPELDSPYVKQDTLDLERWAHDAFVLSLPVSVLCKPGCLGLCPVCAVDLNDAEEEHAHERERDHRFDKLSELRLE